MPEPGRIFKVLRCPYCHSKLIDSPGDSLSCTTCNEKYLIQEGVPLMLSSSKQVELKKKISEWHDSEVMPGFLSYDTIQRLKSPAPFKWFKRQRVLKKIYDEMSLEGIYIDVGGTGELDHPAIFCANLEYGPHTQLVCDGQFLPFEDGSVDGVFIMLVLEHVPDPFAITNEIKRVLKKGGFVVATVPFMQVLHENPKDYFRFTPDGIRRLFDGLDEKKLEIASGPTGSLIWILKEYGALLCPFSNNRLIYASVRELLGWILYPLILLDYYLLTKRRAEKMSSYFFYMGRK
ncbi:MAG: hypothetical protein A2X45_19770 [Lentisphaerae bacterium GWF2_50_93]|nr:MAG: hypothetical protein A2X45_19770 [Lentisphaerae bacterium GWF2_50_93]